MSADITKKDHEGSVEVRVKAEAEAEAKDPHSAEYKKEKAFEQMVEESRQLQETQQMQEEAQALATDKAEQHEALMEDQEEAKARHDRGEVDPLQKLLAEQEALVEEQRKQAEDAEATKKFKEAEAKLAEAVEKDKAMTPEELAAQEVRELEMYQQEHGDEDTRFVVDDFFEDRMRSQKAIEGQAFAHLPNFFANNTLGLDIFASAEEILARCDELNKALVESSETATWDARDVRAHWDRVRQARAFFTLESSATPDEKVAFEKKLADYRQDIEQRIIHQKANPYSNLIDVYQILNLSQQAKGAEVKQAALQLTTQQLEEINVVRSKQGETPVAKEILVKQALAIARNPAARDIYDQQLAISRNWQQAHAEESGGLVTTKEVVAPQSAVVEKLRQVSGTEPKADALQAWRTGQEKTESIANSNSPFAIPAATPKGSS